MMESRLSFSLSDMAAPPLLPSSSGPSPASRPLAASFRPGSPSARPSPPPALRPASSAGRPAPPRPPSSALWRPRWTTSAAARRVSGGPGGT